MSEMVERVARAVREDEVLAEEGLMDDEWWERVARIAIATMREPSEAMMREGFRNNRHRNTTSCEKPHCVGAITLPPDSAWRAMIDEALS